MTSINTFQDILDALEQNPALVDAMRRHLLPDELLALPGQFAEFVRMTQENNRLVAQRLENLEAGQARLEAGQAQLDTRVSNLEAGQARLEAGQAQLDTRVSNLEAGQARLEAGQAQLNTRVSGLEAGQAQLNTRVSGLEAGQARLEAGQAQLDTRASSLETDVAEIKVTLNRMSGDLGRLIGSDYEGFATNLAVRAVRREFGIVQARNVAQQSPKDISYINRLNNEATEKGIITDYEAGDLEQADVIVMGQTEDGAPVYVLAEISVTVHEGDVARALRRAAFLQRASGVRAIPMVIGTALSAQAAEDAESAGVAFVALEQSAPT